MLMCECADVRDKNAVICAIELDFKLNFALIINSVLVVLLGLRPFLTIAIPETILKCDMTRILPN